VLKIAHNHSCAKNPNIQKALLLVLPKLAAFQQEIFVEHFLVQVKPSKWFFSKTVNIK
jgi:hypothetical protein